MRWNKSTRFALYAALEMARRGDGLVTVADVASKYGISSHHLAKILQQLAKAGVAEAVRGIGGGYRLARNPKDVSLLDIVEVFEGRVDPQGCLLSDRKKKCEAPEACRLRRLFDEIERQAFFTLKSVRLSTLAAPPPAA